MKLSRLLVVCLVLVIFVLVLFPGFRRRILGRERQREPQVTAVIIPTIEPQKTAVTTPAIEPQQPVSDAHPGCKVNPDSIVWSADFETADLSQWRIDNDARTIEADSGACSRPEKGVSTEQAHSGRYSMKMTIDTLTGVAGCRQFRRPEPWSGETYYYSAWFYIPELVHVDNFWNIFQFKSQSATESSDVFWKLDIRDTEEGVMRVFPVWKGYVPGPHQGDPIEQHMYRQSLVAIPVGKWFHLEVYLKQSEKYDGHIIVWQDGVEILNEQNVVTKYEGGVQGWSVNHYGANLTPATSSIYIDDVIISTERIDPSC